MLARNLTLVRPLWPTLKRAANSWLAHEGPRLAASLSLYTLLSLAPLVIICIAIASLGFGRSAAQNAIVSQVGSLIGPDGARAIETVIEYGKVPHSGHVASVLGILTLLFGASSVFGELQSALNKIWEAQPDRRSGVMNLIRSRLFSFAMVLALGFLLLVSLMFSATLAALGRYFSDQLSVPKVALIVANELVAFVAISVLIAVILRYVPDRRAPWRPVAEGAIATALLFTIGKGLLGLYLGKFAVGSAYGAAGSLIVTILWVYYAAMIFYFGAEYTRERAQPARAGSSGKHTDR